MTRTENNASYHTFSHHENVPNPCFTLVKYVHFPMCKIPWTCDHVIMFLFFCFFTWESEHLKIFKSPVEYVDMLFTKVKHGFGTFLCHIL